MKPFPSSSFPFPAISPGWSTCSPSSPRDCGPRRCQSPHPRCFCFRLFVPSLWAVDILVVRSAGLTRVVHAPKPVAVGIVGHLYDGDEMRFDDFDEVFDLVEQFPFFEMIADGRLALDVDQINSSVILSPSSSSGSLSSSWPSQDRREIEGLRSNDRRRRSADAVNRFLPLGIDRQGFLDDQVGILEGFTAE